MYIVKEGDKEIHFAHEIDADNYTDYINNGLKLIKALGKTYYFNNGSRLINVSMGDNNRYVLTIYNGRVIRSITLQRKYINLIK